VQTLKPGTFALTALLALLAGIGPFSVDVYLPALPDIGRALHASPLEVQMTLSLYLIGFAIGQILYGPISDALGRKPVLLAAVITYCVAALTCFVSPSIELLIVARFVQGLGASGAGVLARAAVRDLYEGARAGREMSLLTLVMAVAPVIAPVIGGSLQVAFGWRAGFAFLLGVGLLNLVLVTLLLPETLRKPHRGGVGAMVRGFGVIGRHPAFLAYTALAMLGFGGLFGWVAGSPFVLQDLLGLSPVAFGVAYATASVGVACGGFLATRLVTRLGIGRTAGLGAVIMTGGALAMVAATASGFHLAVSLPASMALYLCGYAVMLPQATVGAMMPFPDRAGSASSLLGVAQQSAAALSGMVVSYWLGTSPWPVAIALLGCAAGSLLIWTATRGIRAARTR
jgi:DHA1 family bicyclomycin/chloramphenicol resistance-like MFS transporter